MDIAYEKHIESIRIYFDSDSRAKYEKGQAEHGGELWNKGALFFAKEMRAEAVDQVIYTHCLNDTLALILEVAKRQSAYVGGYDPQGHKVSWNKIIKLLEGTVKDVK